MKWGVGKLADLGCWAVGRRLSQSVAILSLPCSLCTMPWAPALIGTKTIQELYYTTIHRPEPVRASRKKPPPQSGGYGGEVGDRPMRTTLVPLVATAHCCSTIKVSLFPSPCCCKITTTKHCARGFETISRRYQLLMQLYN